jgi:uncharacterized delta-60 repeat protein
MKIRARFVASLAVLSVACQAVLGIEDTTEGANGAGGIGGTGAGADATTGGTGGDSGPDSGGDSSADSDAPNPCDFSVNAIADQSVVRGKSTVFNVSIQVDPCFNGAVDVTIPQALGISAAPTTIAAGGTSTTLTLSATAGASLGAHQITATFSGSQTHQTTFTLLVKDDPGELDQTFNQWGKPGTSVRALAIDSGGYIVAAVNPGWDVARLEPDGMPDAAFAPGALLTSGAANDVAISPTNDAIVLAGSTNVLAVQRRAKTGAADTTLGPNGAYTSFNLPTAGSAYGVAVTSDDRIFVAVELSALSNNSMGLRIDPTIGGSNKVDASWEAFNVNFRWAAVTPTRLLMGGNTNNNVNGLETNPFAAALSASTGDPDPTFGQFTSGIVDYQTAGPQQVEDGTTTQNGIYMCGFEVNAPVLWSFDADGKTPNNVYPGNLSGYRLYGIAAQADDKVVVVGHNTANGQSIVARFNANLSKDTSFAPDEPTPGIRLFQINGGTTQLRAIAIQSDGRIVLGGTGPNGAVIIRLWN